MGKLENIAKTLRSRKKLPFDRKLWSSSTLILYLVKEIRQLRKNQCKPGMHCIHKYDTYLDNIYGTDAGDQLVPYHQTQWVTHPVYVDEDEF